MHAKQPARSHAPTPPSTPGPATAAGDATRRHLHRERDYGIGYGNSSGYGSERRFTHGHADPLFQLG